MTEAQQIILNDTIIETEWKVPKRDPSLTVPVDVTKNKTAVLDFDFGKTLKAHEMPPDATHGMSVKITQQLHIIEWCADVLGYCPQLHIIRHALDVTVGAYLLMFRSNEDATLFTLRFGHLFK